VVAAVAGLLIGVAVAGVAALAITINVGNVVNHALRDDFELEDEADDFRAAVLDLRHYHRNLVFTGPTRTGLADFDAAYAAILEELDELEAVPIDPPGIMSASELRERVTAYYESYRPSVELHATDRAAFEDASDAGLAALAELEQQAQAMEDVAEGLAERALADVERATSTAVLILVAVLIGVGAVGIGLAVAALRVLRELRTLYAAQKETAEQLALALRARTDFIADASHELRTPLTVLRGNAEVGLAAGASECGHEHVLHEIVGETERMTRLVEDLLLLARYDAGGLPLERQEVDVEPWLADVAARGEILARERRVVLAPSLRAVGRAALDPRRLDQAVMVLLDNATKYSPSGGAVGLRAEVMRGWLVIEVSDRGPGIPEDALPFIFERFNRADRSRGERRTGAGLGLSIATAIVSAHGGEIQASSRVGEGTTMTIRVPMARLLEAGAAAPAPVAAPMTAAPPKA
jgi:two-component system, OmpR family, sensor histidine kinase VicK